MSLLDAASKIDLKFSTYYVVPSNNEVFTYFSDGLYCKGTRSEMNLDNQREARSQGYTGSDFIWRSLVEHELLHSLVAEVFFDRPSAVLRTEAGGEFNPSWERYEEEMLCLSVQRYLNTNEQPECLQRFISSFDNFWGLEALHGLKYHMSKYREQLFAPLKPLPIQCPRCKAWYHNNHHLCYMPLGFAYTVDELSAPHIVNGETISKQSHDLFVASQAEFYGWDDNK